MLSALQSYSEKPNLARSISRKTQASHSSSAPEPDQTIPVLAEICETTSALFALPLPVANLALFVGGISTYGMLA